MSYVRKYDIQMIFYKVSVHFYYLSCWAALFSVCFMTARASPAPVYTIDFLYI